MASLPTGEIIQSLIMAMLLGKTSLHQSISKLRVFEACVDPLAPPTLIIGATAKIGMLQE